MLTRMGQSNWTQLLCVYIYNLIHMLPSHFGKYWWWGKQFISCYSYVMRYSPIFFYITFCPMSKPIKLGPHVHGLTSAWSSHDPGVLPIKIPGKCEKSVDTPCFITFCVCKYTYSVLRVSSVLNGNNYDIAWDVETVTCYLVHFLRDTQLQLVSFAGE